MNECQTANQSVRIGSTILKVMTSNGCFCENCKKEIDHNSPSCPFCGCSKKTIKVTINEKIELHFGGRARRRKPFLQHIFGDDYFRKEKKWVKKDRIIDAENNDYLEKIIDKQTGKVIHFCHEPLSQHIGHGSAKVKK